MSEISQNFENAKGSKNRNLAGISIDSEVLKEKDLPEQLRSIDLDQLSQNRNSVLSFRLSGGPNYLRI